MSSKLAVTDSFFRLKLAPFNIPVRRRLETAAVFLVLILGPLFLYLFIFCILNFWTWPLLIPYLIYVAFDSAPENGGRRFDIFRNSHFWRYFSDFFPHELIVDDVHSINENQIYIFGYHPHGILSIGMWTTFCTNISDFSNIFPKLKVFPVTLALNMRFPFWREMLMAHGLCSCSSKSCNNILKSGGSIAIVPGGAREALNANPGTNMLTLRKRKGFIKIAIQNGAHLVPVFSFGENNIWIQVEGGILRRLQTAFLNFFGFSPCLFYGRGIFNYNFGLLPRRKKITTVIGNPIVVEKINKPTISEIDDVQEKYINELLRIYEKYKDIYDLDRKNELQIIE
jgi:2-acylglycerol O-acyltransferase 2